MSDAPRACDDIRIGSRVRISSSSKYAADWPGEYIVTGVRWLYQRGRGQGLDIEIASEEDVRHQYGATSGWSVDDIVVLP